MSLVYDITPYRTSEADRCSLRSRLRNCARSEAGTILDRIRTMKANMHGSWSPICQGTSFTSAHDRTEQSRTRADVHSLLECCVLHMFIGRPFILARRQKYGNDNVLDLNDTAQARMVEAQSKWDFLVKDCVVAAEEAISICHRLQTGIMGLARSSYTEYSSCRASLLVLIAYSICFRTNKFSDSLHRGLDAIREMASVGDSARSEVSLIETLESALHRLHDFDASPGRSGATRANDTVAEDYEGFATWYTRSGTSAKSRSGSLVYNDAPDDQGRSGCMHKADSRPGHNADAPTSSGIPDNVSIDSYPFDFDLLHMDATATFPPANLNGFGDHDRGLLEDLFWMPR